MPGTAVVVLALALQPGSVPRDALSAPCRCVGRNRWKALRERPPHQMWPEATCSSTLNARYRTLAVPRTAVATRPLVLRLTQRLHGAFSVLCDEVVQNRQKAPHQRPPHQMRPEATSSSAPDSHRRALFTPRNAVATRMLALWLTQRLCDALSAPCRYVAMSVEIGGKHCASALHIRCGLKPRAPPPWTPDIGLWPCSEPP
eukprot:COSAG06_NODE_363_length_16808_cov_11.122509_12_plen_201_part_00